MCKINISDCVISGKNVPIKIADKILEYHIRQIERVQRIHDGEITVSEKSCYRPPVYEIKKGRSGEGQHTFVGKGAVDITTSGDLNDLFDLMVEHSGYTRLCIYQNSYFIHGDYKKTDGFIHLYRFTKIKDGKGKESWEWIKFNQVPIKRQPNIDTHGL